MRMRTLHRPIVQIGLEIGAALVLLAGASTKAAADDYGAGPTPPRATTASPSSPATSAVRPQPPSTPPRGTSMARVEREYGEPRRRHAPVGQPPITRWDYPAYRLYFEYDRLIHAVVPADPAPVAHRDELAVPR